MYQQCGPELHAKFHPLFLYPPDYVNAHDAEIEAEQKRAPTLNRRRSKYRWDASMRCLPFDRRAGLASIKSDTLIIAGDNDYITPSYHSQALARAIPGSKLVIFNGGGHSVSKTRAQEFNKTVLDFLHGADDSVTILFNRTSVRAAFARLKTTVDRGRPVMLIVDSQVHIWAAKHARASMACTARGASPAAHHQRRSAQRNGRGRCRSRGAGAAILGGRA
jgi:dienelactone hydrolase